MHTVDNAYVVRGGREILGLLKERAGQKGLGFVPQDGELVPVGEPALRYFQADSNVYCLIELQKIDPETGRVNDIRDIGKMADYLFADMKAEPIGI